MQNNDSQNMLQHIVRSFSVDPENIQLHGTGLINQTWKVQAKDKNYILQRINDHVFRRPADIDHNIQLIDQHLKQYHPEYFFVSPMKTIDGKTMYHAAGEGWFRLSPFVENSITIDVVGRPEQAYEAAAQFGKFTAVLSGIDIDRFKITIPDFHNLSLRFKQFETAVNYGNEKRRMVSGPLIRTLFSYAGIVKEYERHLASGQFIRRVTHHDTKISNVLFDKDFHAICVIDLDTVMPGYFISDVGDMMRTYLSPVSEEERDFDKIRVRKDFYDAIVEGYRDQMKDHLNSAESEAFLFAGKYMIYMQALRFLTDYLNNDIYYGSKYEGHNFLRAGNQVRLLEEISKLSA